MICCSELNLFKLCQFVLLQFILIFSIIGYTPLNEKLKTDVFPYWAEIIGFLFLFIPVLPIPIMCVVKITQSQGSLLQVSTCTLKIWNICLGAAVSTLSNLNVC